MPSISGYLRSDLIGKSIQTQLDQLKAAGVTRLYQEQASGAKQDRPQLATLLADVRAGDTVVVTSLDRIARNTRHLLEIVEALNAAGVSLQVLDQGIDTAPPHGEVLHKLLGAITDFERQTVRQRQAEGIAKAKQEGRYKGRKPIARAKADKVLALNAQGLTRQKIAEQLGIGVASVYRILKSHTAPQKTRVKTQQKPVVKTQQEPVVETQQKPVVRKKRAGRKKQHESSDEQLSFF